MDDNIDVVKELEIKNREIFDNKIIIDLEKTMDSLIMFYGNYCDTVSNEVINTINLYLDKKDDTSCEMISNLVTSFFTMLKGDLNKIVNARLTLIKADIQSINSFNYEKKLTNESLIIANQISDFYQEKIYELIDAVKDNVKEHSLDLKDYLLTAVYLKLMNTLKDKLMYSVKLINNNYDENTTILQSINEKTLK